MTTGHQELLQRIRMEYLEMPDLRLTPRQARRLWNLEPALSEELMAALVGEGFLVRTQDGSFLRRGDDAPINPSRHRAEPGVRDLTRM